MMSRISVLFLILLNYALIAVECCNRKPQGATGDQSAVDDNFQIIIDGNPSSYIPGQAYNVTLFCPTNFKFLAFTIVAEMEPDAPPGYDMTGHFEIINSAETRFSPQCENMIENSNTNIKTRVDVTWVAPTNPNSTCVYIKAAVLQHRNVWFADGSFLIKSICPEEIDDVNSQTPLVNPCCACDEAKYELILERRWNRNTHSKYFPREDWRTRFSELIGASHTFDYRFWAYGEQASRGLKELAEHGATRTLEDEIKENTESGSIRTIIKAPGIPYRSNVISTTLSTVRVDPRRHMISLVSKIIPSPDWILGVAGLELCLANCTWVERKILNLFPWDVGTDAGASYESPDQQQIPADVIRRISSTYPSDYRSPFYDETGAAMKPMATLYITRKKIYERECELDDNVEFECTTHPWIDWSECSSRCGRGRQYRTRGYKDPDLAARYNCANSLREEQDCEGTQCGQEGVEYEPQLAECELMPWGQWSPCSKSCGNGISTRTRDYRNPNARQNCQAGVPVKLDQTRNCVGNDCGGSIPNVNNNGDYGRYPNEPTLREDDNYNQQTNPTQRGGSVNERWDTSNSYPNRPFTDNYNNDNNNNDFNIMPEGASIDEGYPNSFNFGEPNNYAETAGYDQQNKNVLWVGNNLQKPQYGNRENIQSPKQNHEDRYASNYGQPYQRPTSRYQSGGAYPSQQEYPSVNADNRKESRAGEEFCYEMPHVAKRYCPIGRNISNWWFFDAGDFTCKLFTTNLCDENRNKFRTLEACEETCANPISQQEATQFQQPEPGRGYNSFPNQFGWPQSQVRAISRNEQRRPQEERRQFRRNDATTTAETIAGDIEAPMKTNWGYNNRRLGNQPEMRRNNWNNQYRAPQTRRKPYEQNYENRNHVEQYPRNIYFGGHRRY